MAFDLLGEAGVHVATMVDRAPEKAGGFGDVTVLHPDEVAPQPDATLLVTTVSTAFGPLAEELVGRGWTRVEPFYDYALSLEGPCRLTNGWFSGALSADDEQGMADCLLSLADVPSRAAYLQHLAWRVRREDWIFEEAPVEKASRYWIEPMAADLCKTERFVDVGAYDGRVLGQLLTRTGGDFVEAHLIEPDQCNRAKLSAFVEELPRAQRAKVAVMCVAASDRAGAMSFNGEHGYASKLGNGSKVVQAMRLDDLDLRPTLLKLHIEGSELAALKGAGKTINKWRPKIAATVYHNRDGLWRTLKHLLDTLEDYRLFFRLHAWCATGAVVYAVPRTSLA